MCEYSPYIIHCLKCHFAIPLVIPAGGGINYREGTNVFDNKKDPFQKGGICSLPQSQLKVDDGSDSIRPISVGGNGVILSGVVAEQKHLLAVEGVLGPGDI